MKANLKTLFAIAGIGLATLATSAAIAQPGQGRGPGQGAAASQGRAQERLLAADTDKDGLISKEEAEKGMPRMGVRFAAIDTNQDGKLSPEEFQTMRNNMRGTGRPQGAGPQAAPSLAAQGIGPGSRMGGRSSGMQRAGMRGQGQGRLCAISGSTESLSRADIEKLARPNALTRFDALDSNKDGKLSAEERAACPAAKG